MAVEKSDSIQHSYCCERLALKLKLELLRSCQCDPLYSPSTVGEARFLESKSLCYLR